jgi:sulfate adenylyltransferase
VTADHALPADAAALPTYLPSPVVLGQVELALEGVFGDDARLTLAVPAETGQIASTTGALILTDDEGTPLAALTVTDVPAANVQATGARDANAQATGAAIQLSGPLQRLGEARTGPFRALRRTPTQVRAELDEAPALAVATGRPLLRHEEAELASAADGAGARVVVLPCLLRTAGPPPEVLIRAIQASQPRLATAAGAALVVPLPVPATDSGQPAAGVLEFITAAGAAPYEDGQLEPSAGWRQLTTALDATAATDPLGELVTPEVAAVLRGWRPPRAERGITVFFTGLSGSGKSTVARGVADAMLERGRTVTSVDGDVARRMLSAGLTFSRADRDLNILRIGWVASEVTRHGGVAICAPIAPYAATRDRVRELVEANGDFVLVHVSTPLEVCEQRDRKGLYAKARAGLIENFTGISDPYEEPDDADLTIDTSAISVDDAVGQVIGYLTDGGWLTG